jgi:transposase
MTRRDLRDARIAERKFKELVKMFGADVPALTASKLAVVNRKSGPRIAEWLRRRALEMAGEEAKPCTGQVELAEGSFGPRRGRGKGGRGAAGKTPVGGLLKGGGRVCTSVGQNCSKAELEPISKGQVLSQAPIATDGWKADDGLVLGGAEHPRLHHHENEFARGKNPVPGLESFRGQAKFRFIKLRGLRQEFFCLHLKESAWRGHQRLDHRSFLLRKNLRQNPL